MPPVSSYSSPPRLQGLPKPGVAPATQAGTRVSSARSGRKRFPAGQEPPEPGAGTQHSRQRRRGPQRAEAGAHRDSPPPPRRRAVRGNTRSPRVSQQGGARARRRHVRGRPAAPAAARRRGACGTTPPRGQRSASRGPGSHCGTAAPSSPASSQSLSGTSVPLRRGAAPPSSPSPPRPAGSTMPSPSCSGAAAPRGRSERGTADPSPLRAFSRPPARRPATSASGRTLPLPQCPAPNHGPQW